MTKIQTDEFVLPTVVVMKTGNRLQRLKMMILLFSLTSVRIVQERSQEHSAMMHLTDLKEATE